MTTTDQMIEITFPGRRPARKRTGMLIRFRPELEQSIKLMARKSGMTITNFVSAAVCLHGKEVEPGMTFRIVLVPRPAPPACPGGQMPNDHAGCPEPADL